MSDADLYDEILAAAGDVGPTDAFSTSDLFPNDADAVTLYSHDLRTLSNLWKLSWLIGTNVHIVTPHVLVRKIAYDLSDWPDPSNPSRHSQWYYGDKYFQWKRQVLDQLGATSPTLLPAFSVTLHHDYDFDDDTMSHKQIYVEGSNLQSPVVLPQIAQQLSNSLSISVDIPVLILADQELVNKVQADYPIASSAFKTLIKDSYTTFQEELQAGTDAATILERLNDEIVQPGVNKIRAEHKELNKNAILRASADTIGLSMPLIFSSLELAKLSPFLAELLSAGIGLKLIHRILDLRSSHVKLKKDAFFAGLKLELQ